MSLLTVKQVIPYESVCFRLLKESGVRFVGVINNQGRLVAGGFKDGIKPYENDERRRMMYMELVLDLSMRKEFDGTLGSIKSITSRRENVNITTIPLQENLLLISSNPDVSEKKLISKAWKAINKFCKT